MTFEFEERVRVRWGQFRSTPGALITVEPTGTGGVAPDDVADTSSFVLAVRLESRGPGGQSELPRLAHRVQYGGRKGRRAARRLLALPLRVVVRGEEGEVLDAYDVRLCRDG